MDILNRLLILILLLILLYGIYKYKNINNKSSSQNADCPPDLETITTDDISLASVSSNTFSFMDDSIVSTISHDLEE